MIFKTDTGWVSGTYEKRRGMRLVQYLFLRALCGSVGDAEHFFLTHDEELFAIDLDLGSGILAEQDAVARLYFEGVNFAFFVALAFADGDDFAFLWFVFS